MFLNIMPIVSFLLLCLLLNASDELARRKLIPEFIAGKLVASVLGTLILFWGLFQFYANMNYFIYQVRYELIAVLLRLIVVLYFIVSGIVISFKGFGDKLFSKKHIEAEKRYKHFSTKLSSLQLTLAKISALLLALFVLNYLFVK